MTVASRASGRMGHYLGPDTLSASHAIAASDKITLGSGVRFAAIRIRSNSVVEEARKRRGRNWLRTSRVNEVANAQLRRFARRESIGAPRGNVDSHTTNRSC